MTGVRHLLALGPLPPFDEVVAVLERYPAEAAELVYFMHKAYGNRYVAEVVKRWNTGNAKQQPPAGVVANAELEPAVVADTQVSTSAPAPAETTDKYSDLLATPHNGTRGPDGTAAWLLEAVKLGLIEARDGAADELQQFVDDAKLIRTKEGRVSKEYEKKGRAKAKREGHPIDNVHDVKGSRTQFDVEIDQAPILETLVGLVTNRVTTWRAAGSKGAPRKLEIQNLVRGDPGYGGSVHTNGIAVDIGIANDDLGGFLQVLEDLPPGARVAVFPDGEESMHVNHHADSKHQAVGGDFDFGFPKSFFDMLVAKDKDHFPAAQKQVEMEEGADHTKPLTAKRLVWGSRHVYGAHAKWDDATGAWKWSSWDTTGGTAEDHLKNKKLKTALAGLGKKSTP